jgi:hypothetical protein
LQGRHIMLPAAARFSGSLIKSFKPAFLFLYRGIPFPD